MQRDRPAPRVFLLRGLANFSGDAADHGTEAELVCGGSPLDDPFAPLLRGLNLPLPGLLLRAGCLCR